MITCVVDYIIDPAKTADFERFAIRWIELVEQHGGTHHGYFLPPRVPATELLPFSASRALLLMSGTAAGSAPTRTS